jgi:hypothetical protein
VRGTTQPVKLALGKQGTRKWQAERFDPRNGARHPLPVSEGDRESFEFQPPDTQDWLVVLQNAR